MNKQSQQQSTVIADEEIPKEIIKLLENDTTGLMEFVDWQIRFNQGIIEKRQKTKRGARFIEENIMAHLGVLEKRTVDISLNENEQFESDVMDYFVQVMHCIYRLQDVLLITFKRTNYRSPNIMNNKYTHKCDVFQLKDEYFFQEMYTLREHIRFMINNIAKRYKLYDDKYSRNIVSFIDGIKPLVAGAFKEVSELRDRHIHRELYNSREVAKLKMFANLIMSEEEEKKREYYIKEYNKNYRKQVKLQEDHFTTNVKRCKGLVNILFGTLLKQMLTEKKRFRIPF